MTYQYHITINPIEGESIRLFDDICRKWGGKAILILLPRGDYAEQPMLSLTVNRDFDLKGAIDEANTYAREIDNKGYQTRRVKIEVPAMDYKQVKVENFDPYFEWHCLIEYREEEGLHILCREHSLHISRNFIEQNKRYLTLRLWGSYDEYLTQTTSAREQLEKIGIRIVKEKNEYCVYDSNALLDKGWVS